MRTKTIPVILKRFFDSVYVTEKFIPSTRTWLGSYVEMGVLIWEASGHFQGIGRRVIWEKPYLRRGMVF